MIRETTEEDAGAIVRLLNAVHSTRVGSEQGFLHRVRSTPERAHRRSWAAIEDDEILGVATVGLNYESSTRSWFASVTVAPERRGAGLGGELAARALAHAGAGERVVCEVDDLPEAVRFAESHGFHRTFTRRHSAVDPSTVGVEQLPDGFELVPLSELEPEGVFAVDVATAEDVPLDDAMDALQLEQWLLDYWEHPDIDRTASFAICREGRPVAITYLRLNPATARGLNDYTATLPEFRGRGLARIVKAAALRAAASRGTTIVLTQNDETNAPMLAVNARLGYRPYAQSHSYLRES